MTEEEILKDVIAAADDDDDLDEDKEEEGLEIVDESFQCPTKSVCGYVSLGHALHIWNV